MADAIEWYPLTKTITFDLQNKFVEDFLGKHKPHVELIRMTLLEGWVVIEGWADLKADQGPTLTIDDLPRGFV